VVDAAAPPNAALSEDIAGKEGHADVVNTGMAFMRVKNGVFESMNHSWFRSIKKRSNENVDFSMKKVAFLRIIG
jgi:hypothetical protein